VKFLFLAASMYADLHKSLAAQAAPARRNMHPLQIDWQVK